MKKTQKGFTLVELLVVIAILAIFATVSVVGYTSFIEKANVSNAQTEAHQIKTAITSALIIPGEEYTIATITERREGTTSTENASSTADTDAIYTIKVTIKLEDNKYIVTNMPSEGIDLDADNVTSDFKGLKGTLKIENNNLVYVPDSKVANQIIVAVSTN